MLVLEFVADVTMAIGKMLVAGTFQRHRAVKFIFAHYGGTLPVVMDRLENTYAMLLGRKMVPELPEPLAKRSPTLYFDTQRIELARRTRRRTRGGAGESYRLGE